MSRKIVQIAPMKMALRDNLFALCDDGSLWAMEMSSRDWTPLRGIPNETLDHDGTLLKDKYKNVPHDKFFVAPKGTLLTLTNSSTPEKFLEDIAVQFSGYHANNVFGESWKVRHRGQYYYVSKYDLKEMEQEND